MYFATAGGADELLLIFYQIIGASAEYAVSCPFLDDQLITVHKEFHILLVDAQGISDFFWNNHSSQIVDLFYHSC